MAPDFDAGRAGTPGGLRGGIAAPHKKTKPAGVHRKAGKLRRREGAEQISLLYRLTIREERRKVNVREYCYNTKQGP